MSGRYEEILALGRADDPACGPALAGFTDPELVGELMTALYLSGTPAARAALRPLYTRPFRRGFWQGCKRITKLAEAAFDAETWCELAFVIDQARPEWSYWKTHAYMLRRSYRHLKRVALERPEAFLDHLERLLPRYAAQAPSLLVQRLLRLERLREAEQQAQAVARFSPALENPFAAAEEEGHGGDELLELDDAALLRAEPPVEEELAAAPATPRRWPGPIFAELWVQDPGWLVALLERTRHAPAAAALVRLLEEQVGERLHEVPLEACYRLLEHSLGPVWRLGLGQLAARARQELLHFDRLIALFERARAEGPDWGVIADLLFVLDDERADAARAGLGGPLRDLICAHPDEPGIGPVVGFLRRHLGAELGHPLFRWPQALTLLEGKRPDVRELGRDVTLALADSVRLDPRVLQQLLHTSLVEEDPEAVQRLLTHTETRPRGFRPPEAWSAAECLACLEALPQPGFDALRRALLGFEGDGGLDPELGRLLLESDARRSRQLGRELLGAALERGALALLDLVALLETRHEDVVVWLQERLEAAAAGGRLPNEALYQMLDAVRADVQGFARGLVQEHLQRFEEAELIVFCAESPDAATADLGIELYERELKGQGFDLQALLPMFQILLYKVATARREKDRLFQTLRRWGAEAEAHAHLVVGVVEAFRRSQARLDFSRALTLLVELKARYPELELPFAVRSVFGWTPAEAVS